MESIIFRLAIFEKITKKEFFKKLTPKEVSIWTIFGQVKIMININFTSCFKKTRIFTISNLPFFEFGLLVEVSKWINLKVLRKSEFKRFDTAAATPP